MANLIRSQRESEILQAALLELEEKTPDQISMSSLSKRLGISRTALYQYFASIEDVFADLVISDLAELIAEIDQRVKKHSDPFEQIRVWIHYSLMHQTTGEHAIIRKISEQNLTIAKRKLIGAMHGQLMHSLSDPISDLGFQNASQICGSIFAILNASAKRVESGSDFLIEAKICESFIMSGLENMTTGSW